jgi:SH3-like domain-containing protein
MMRFAAIFAILAILPAVAQPVGAHYVSQRAARAYLREGPTYQHKVLWVYRHKGYPFRVIAAFDIWRRVKAPDGTVGWMAASMLSDQRTVLVTGKGRVPIYAAPGDTRVVALADPGATAALTACAPAACRIRGEGIEGWIPKSRIWGVDANEVFDKVR